MDKQAVFQDIYSNAFADELTKTAFGAGLIAKGIGALGRFAASNKTNFVGKAMTGLADIGRPTGGGPGALVRGARYMGTRSGNIAGAAGLAGLAGGAMFSPFKNQRAES